VQGNVTAGIGLGWEGRVGLKITSISALWGIAWIFNIFMRGLDHAIKVRLDAYARYSLGSVYFWKVAKDNLVSINA
jgi:hypothetical protein